MSKKSQKQAKEKLPGLEQRYQYRLKRRSTPEGLALEALGGDKAVIAKLADVGACIMRAHWKRSRDGNAEYAWWLASILSDIANGAEPNKAFGWNSEKGQWKLHNGETWERLKKAYEVGRTIEQFAANITGKSYEDAIDHAAEVWRIKPDECRRVMTSERAGEEQLGKTSAVELALDIVSAHGACGHRAARETARDYYKELTSSRGTV